MTAGRVRRVLTLPIGGRRFRSCCSTTAEQSGYNRRTRVPHLRDNHLTSERQRKTYVWQLPLTSRRSPNSAKFHFWHTLFFLNLSARPLVCLFFFVSLQKPCFSAQAAPSSGAHPYSQHCSARCVAALTFHIQITEKYKRKNGRIKFR